MTLILQGCNACISKFLKPSLMLILPWMAILLLSTDLPAQNAKDVAIVLKKVGAARVNPTGKGKWYRLRKGVRLSSGNVVQTGKKSLVSVVFSDDKSLLKIRENSRVVIRGKRQQRSITKTIFMRLGELWTRVTQGTAFRVETPTGVAVVKGTEFTVKINSAGVMIVDCIAGIIELLNDAGSIELTPGMRGILRSRSEAPVSQEVGIQGELEIDFENDTGSKKALKIQFNSENNEQE